MWVLPKHSRSIFWKEMPPNRMCKILLNFFRNTAPRINELHNMVLERSPGEHVYRPIMRDKVLSLFSRWQTVTDFVRDSCIERGFMVDTVNYLFPHSARYAQAKAVAFSTICTSKGCCPQFSHYIWRLCTRTIQCHPWCGSQTFDESYNCASCMFSTPVFENNELWRYVLSAFPPSDHQRAVIENLDRTTTSILNATSKALHVLTNNMGLSRTGGFIPKIAQQRRGCYD